MFANTKESGLEMLIVKWLVEHNGYEEGSNADYNKEYAIDETRLFRFLQDTQPEQMDKLGVFKFEQKKRQFLNRLQGEIAKRGIIDVLRNGIKVYPVDLIMFYLTPTEKNAKAREMFEKNIFSVTRQLRYAQDAGKLALDMCVFINGLPVITFELKNQLTKQNVDDAVQQYKAFVRTYGFLGAILPYGNADWERLSIFLNLLIPKLPSPREDDLSQGILETIDLESYRNEAREVMSIRLEDTDTEVAPVPAGKVGHIVEPEMDLLSVILSNFNDMFGNINWNDADNVRRQILEIPAMVSKDEKYQNAMRNSDEQSARMESERALQQVIFSIMADNMELFKQFQDNPSFKKWLSDLVFNLTYNKDGKPYENPDAASTD